MTIYWA